MLSIQPHASQTCTPNLLPAHVHHNGRISSTPRYWAPTADENGTQHVHFRGRHLHGTPLRLPPHYTGAVLCITDKLAPQTHAQSETSVGEQAAGPEDDEDGDEVVDERPEEVRIAEQIGEFEEVVVWGHGGTVDEGSDMFVRGVREWVGFAESMHCDEEDEAAADWAKAS